MMLKDKNKEIKITKEQFVKTFMDVLANPFKGDNTLEEQDKSGLQFNIMLTGMLILQRVQEELFGKED